MFSKTPLALLNLTYNKRKLVLSLVVIAFAVFLMFMQLGFRSALLDSNVAFIRSLDADLIVTNKRRYVSFMEQTFHKQRLYQLQGFKGVSSAYPFYIGTAIWKSKNQLSERPIRVFAYNPFHNVFLIDSVRQKIDALRLNDTILADIKSRKEFGELSISTIAELSNRKVRVAGSFELGTDFIADGNIITSDQNFLRLFLGYPSGNERNIRRSLDEVDLGLVKLEPDVAINGLIKAILSYLPADVVIMSKQAFIQQDIDYWLKATPIGFMFALGTFVGFVVGIIVVYNILYSDIEDNLPQYATLKAMGYPNSFLLCVVMQEALLISVLGFLPGFCFSSLFYNLMVKTTGLQMHMSTGVFLLVFVLTLVMCMSSGAIAVRKLKKTDPADIFG
jgi:putative ABC transport system permease protein